MLWSVENTDSDKGTHIANLSFLCRSRIAFHSSFPFAIFIFFSSLLSSIQARVAASGSCSENVFEDIRNRDASRSQKKFSIFITLLGTILAGLKSDYLFAGEVERWKTLTGVGAYAKDTLLEKILSLDR